MTGKRGPYKSNPNPRLSEESKRGVLKYLSNYKGRYELKWDNYLTIENKCDIYGWRGKNASQKDEKLYHQVTYANSRPSSKTLSSVRLAE